MQSVWNIGFDVVSGLITTFVLFLLTVFAKYWLIPLIKRIKYDGPDISGQWHCESKLGITTYVYGFKIDQNAHKLKGDASIIKNHGGSIEYNQKFRLTGEIFEGYVILNLRSADNKSLSFSTGIFQIENRGNSLEGILSYRVRVGNGVSSENISFLRV